MLLHRAVAAFGAGSSGASAPKFEPEKQHEAAGGEGESDGTPRDNDGAAGAAKSDGIHCWMSSYVDLAGDHVGRHSSMKMDCGWYGHDGAFGSTGLSVGTTVADSLPPPELLGPIPPTPDCPVCLVPMPLDMTKVMYFSCCGKEVCSACYNEYRRSVNTINLTRKSTLSPVQAGCLFCRATPQDDSDAEYIEHFKARIRKGDGRAAWNLASFYEKGDYGLARDESRALQMHHTAANLGSVEAMSHLGYLYTVGKYNGTKTQVIGKRYLEAAALKGDVYAYGDLADIELNDDNCEVAMKHFRLAASAGHVPAMKRLWTCFQKKELSKEDLEETLRAHKAACDQMISTERERLLAYEAAKKSEDELLMEHYQSYYDGKISAKVLERVVRSHQGLGLKT